MENLVDRIKADVELRPYFFNLICRGFVLGLSDTFQVSDSDRVRFQKDYYDTMLSLSNEIKKKFNSDKVLPIIQQVSIHYLKHIGRINFEEYEPIIE